MELYTGVVENRIDPLKLGRCQVRIVGLHTHDKSILPTADLPWAYPLQPITSAAMSGIGSSPIGPVEGTWVVVCFRDDEQQLPIMIGTVGGIPDSSNSIESDDSNVLVVKQDGDLVVDSTTTGESTGGTTQNRFESSVVENAVSALKRAGDFKASDKAYAIISNFEGYFSKSPTLAQAAKPGDKVYSYYDKFGKVWTIGYGSTSINGSPVIENQVITYEAALAELKKHVEEVAAASVRRNVRVPVTQSMFDALTSLAYNIGSGRFAKSSLLSDLNSGKYLDAAASFLLYSKSGGQELPGLVKRRMAEKTLFMAEGVPNEAGEIKPTDNTEETAESTPSNPSTTGQTQANAIGNSIGFRDPNGKYPLYFNEPDTNRLARNEEINKTIVFKKEAGELKNVPIAGGGTWDQPRTPYDAVYPFNHVMQTESGHVLEFDDTAHSERIHIYHRTGTFTEIDPNGSQINRIVGDGYEIYERNGYIKINGSCNVTIDGAHNVKVGNALNLEVSGATTVNIYNDAKVNVSGSMQMSVAEEFKLAAKSISLESTGGNVDILSAGDLNTQASGGNASIRASGIVAADGVQTRIQEGSSSSANGANLVTPADRQSPEMPSFNELRITGRSSSAAYNYETPEDGDPRAYKEKQIDNGNARKEDLEYEGEKQEEASATKSTITPKVASCDIIYNTEKFDPTFVLSKRFKLGALTKNGARPVVAQQGATVQEIVCNLKGLAENCLDVIYDMYPNMIITSGFRRPEDAPNSSPKSDHYTGRAVDIVIPNLDRKGHWEAIQKIQTMVPYRQLILEYQGPRTVWIHLSFDYKEKHPLSAFTMNNHSKVPGSEGKFIYIA